MFCKKLNNIGNIKSNWSEQVSTRRSIVLSLLLQLVFPACTTRNVTNHLAPFVSFVENECYEYGPRSRSYKTFFGVNLLTILLTCRQIFSLQKSVSKFTPKKFYEIDSGLDYVFQFHPFKFRKIKHFLAKQWLNPNFLNLNDQIPPRTKNDRILPIIKGEI